MPELGSESSLQLLTKVDTSFATVLFNESRALGFRKTAIMLKTIDTKDFEPILLEDLTQEVRAMLRVQLKAFIRHLDIKDLFELLESCSNNAGESQRDYPLAEILYLRRATITNALTG